MPNQTRDRLAPALKIFQTDTVAAVGGERDRRAVRLRRMNSPGVNHLLAINP